MWTLENMCTLLHGIEILYLPAESEKIYNIIVFLTASLGTAWFEALCNKFTYTPVKYCTYTCTNSVALK